jgi:hypothetical protein
MDVSYLQKTRKFNKIFSPCNLFVLIREMFESHDNLIDEIKKLLCSVCLIQSNCRQFFPVHSEADNRFGRNSFKDH